METNHRIPEHFEPTALLDSIMSNFDHHIDEDVANEIKGKELTAAYPGYNFHGTVWWQNESWHCEVWVYGSYQNTISDPELSEIMSEVCNRYVIGMGPISRNFPAIHKTYRQAP